MRFFDIFTLFCLIGVACANVDQSTNQLTDSKSIESAVPLATASVSAPVSSSSGSVASTASAGPESRQILAGNPLQSGSGSANPSFANFPFNAYNSAQFVSSLNANPASLSGSLSSLNSPTGSASGNSLLSMLRPQQTGGRRSSLTNRLKNFMSSFFGNGKENNNINANNPYLASGSSYSFAYKQPPFNFQPSSSSSAFGPSSSSNAASLGSFGDFASASAYRPVVFPAYPGSSNNPSSLSSNSNLNTFAGSLDQGSLANNYKSQFGSSSAFNQALAPSTSYWSNNANNVGSLGSSLGSASFAPNQASPNGYGSFPNNAMFSGFQAAASSHSNVYSQPAPNSNLNGNNLNTLNNLNNLNNPNNNINNNNQLNGNIPPANLNGVASSSSSSSASGLRNQDNNQ